VPPVRPDMLDPQLVRALAHPLRVQILEVLNEREASPNELMELLGYPLGNVAYHTRVLEKCGCVEEVGTKRRRGAVEHYFRAKPRSFVGHQDWRQVPRSVRSEVSGAALGGFVERAVDALEAGKIDDRGDSTLSWMTMAVDEKGWEAAAAVLREAIGQLEKVADESRARLAQNGAEAVPMIAAVTAFETVPRPGDED
jgi:DNA-binding transcriptional ArsR family regulator